MLSALASEHVAAPRNVGPLEGATHEGRCEAPGGGPYAQLWLRVERGVIRAAAYRANGCPSSTACASLGAQHQKEKLLSIHESQFNGERIQRVSGMVAGSAEIDGEAAGVALAEGFRCVRSKP